MSTITLSQFTSTTTQASAVLASAWSQAAANYSQWVTETQQGIQSTAQQKFDKLATELGQKTELAARNADTWQQAARDAGNTGIADLMQKYSDKFSSQARDLLNQQVDAKVRLDAVAQQTKTAINQASDLFKGNLGTAIGPAFDAYQMADGVVEWYQTGKSDKFGGAAMGVLLSAGGGLFLGFLAGFAFVGMPVVIAAGIGALIGAASGERVYEAFRDAVSPLVESFFAQARNWRPPYDPLVLDLDGDGIETVGITPGAPLLFDHDGDGVKNATGWIKPDDGLLVLDLNGNGSIDSGRELFGDNTLLPSGSTALQGYQALAQHDSNLDGKISHLDALFNQLRLWQDNNQDGISQSTELKTLSQAGIQSISVQASATSAPAINLGNGNAMPWKSTYTKTDGTNGVSGGVELSGSLLLADMRALRACQRECMNKRTRIPAPMRHMRLRRHAKDLCHSAHDLQQLLNR
jgi:hypothetical protein